MQYLFPFKKVKRDSRVIIYGAGRVGQEYIWQVDISQYADVLCIVDKKYPNVPDLGVEMNCPEKIKEYDFDYIVVAVADYSVRKEIVKELSKKSFIPLDKIVYEVGYLPTKMLIQRSRYQKNIRGLAYEKKGLSIAVHLLGGLGDMVVYKRFLEELAKWSNDICIDVYVRPNNGIEIVESILINCSYINKIIDDDYYSKDNEQYSFEFEWGLDLLLLEYEPKCLENYPQIYEWIKEIEVINSQYGVLSTGKLQSIFFARCEKEGMWRYTAYNRYPGFNVQDYHTNIPLNDEFYQTAKNLCREPYLTINYGWGGSKKQAKVWPKEYEEELIKKIHDKYSGLKIVQVGGQGFPKLAGCDAYVFGYDFEIVKHVLKNSLVHIDCEGGLVHLATQLGTRCIVLFGPTPIKFYGYPDNINIQVGKCHNCCWLVDNNYECYRGMEKPECMYSITPDIVMSNIVNCLENIING